MPAKAKQASVEWREAEGRDDAEAAVVKRETSSRKHFSQEHVAVVVDYGESTDIYHLGDDEVVETDFDDIDSALSGEFDMKTKGERDQERHVR